MYLPFSFQAPDGPSTCARMGRATSFADCFHDTDGRGVHRDLTRTPAAVIPNGAEQPCDVVRAFVGIEHGKDVDAATGGDFHTREQV